MSMRIDILTLFPAMFRGPFDESIIKRAVESGVVSIHTHDIREWAKGRHKVADDYPYGGGPGMVLVDAVVRHLPGALGSPDSAGDESFAGGLLEAPPYTRPPEFRGWEVPDVLLSGNHPEVARWRRRRNLLWTAQRRPDLLETARLTDEDREWLAANQVAAKEGDL